MKIIQDEIRSFLDQYLITVQKPGRYTGGEYNQIIKDWQQSDLSVALAFPDIYDIGFSNLGLSILYDIINKQDRVLAERVFAPWPDFEELLKSHKIPLHTLESKTPLRFFDLIGFSLPYETLYTNLINMLDLAKISIHSNKRTQDDPIILAGGHACFNPEPMHAFIDAFAIGEGEDIILDIINKVKLGKQNGFRRQAIIDSLADIVGVYVPPHYQVTYDTQGNISEIENIITPNKFFVMRRIVEKLPPPPTRLLVPNIQVVHDRVAVEIMRGCNRGCRFCQSGFITRPVRERPVKEIVNAISDTIQNTGYEEVSLLSLSSSDYSRINELILEVNKLGKDLKFNISLPSLRIETFDNVLVDSMKAKRKGNFTLAPESSSERIRRQINKPIDDHDFLSAIEKIFSMGWQNIKLYYMIGFPGETVDDVRKIASMCGQIFRLGKKILGRKPKIHVSINTFIPKPHTPFQWCVFPSMQDINAKYKLIREEMEYPAFKLDWSDYNNSFLEACLSRGDRRMSTVIETAWKNGCKFDAWQEHFLFEQWLNAFELNHLEPDIFLSDERHINSVLPWDHIHTGVDKSFLIGEFKKSQDQETTANCMEKCHTCGIQIFCTKNCKQLRTDN